MPDMQRSTEKLTVVTNGYVNEDQVTRGLIARGWLYAFARNAVEVTSRLNEHRPEALCILSVALLRCDDKVLGGILRTSVENGVARVAVASLKFEEMQDVWDAMFVKGRTKLKTFPQPRSVTELKGILDFVTGQK